MSVETIILDKNHRLEKVKQDSITKHYYYKGKNYHRLDGPAILEFQHDIIYKFMYIVKGLVHREDGPAWVEYFIGTNIVSKEYYYFNNILHREDGPARIIYNIDGTIQHFVYNIMGKPLSSEDFLVYKLNKVLHGYYVIINDVENKDFLIKDPFDNIIQRCKMNNLEEAIRELMN